MKNNYLSKRNQGKSHFSFFFIEFSFFFSGGILILLIFGYEIVHVGFGFGEFHFVHTFSGVPM
jgi:hypothetical protein